jgi:hypothetical protein
VEVEIEFTWLSVAQTVLSFNCAFRNGEGGEKDTLMERQKQFEFFFLQNHFANTFAESGNLIEKRMRMFWSNKNT